LFIGGQPPLALTHARAENNNVNHPDQSAAQVDVVIVGGGPAGLSAALMLGRCRRRVLLFDHGRYRNARARRVHGYLTRDGTDPNELRRIGRTEIAQYPNVAIREAEVEAARPTERGFELQLQSGERIACRKLLLATGVVDRLPALPGIDALLGVCAFHCPYCDGWERRDQPLVAYGAGDTGAVLALELTMWSSDVALCTGGNAPSSTLRERLRHFAIDTHEQPIARVSGSEDAVVITFEDGSTLSRRALFYSEGCVQGAPLAEQLGLQISPRGGVEVGRLETTNVPGVYVAGDASRDALQAIVAAGEGSTAAIAINRALFKEDVLGA
jgi:thioredoxin reductase